MKKLLSLVLCLGLVLGIAGCGRDNEKNLLTNPADKDVNKAIEKIDGVKSTCMVTEDNDPNGQLNKDGGYTGAVYFRLIQVDDNISYEDDACEAGTSGGGQIEIYKNKEDAKNRNDYLSDFDDSILGDYHTIKGTLVIRLSNDLTASQQKDLSKKIIDVLSSTKISKDSKKEYPEGMSKETYNIGIKSIKEIDRYLNAEIDEDELYDNLDSLAERIDTDEGSLSLGLEISISSICVEINASGLNGGIDIKNIKESKKDIEDTLNK